MTKHRTILTIVWIATLTVLAIWTYVFRKLRRFMKRQEAEP